MARWLIEVFEDKRHLTQDGRHVLSPAKNIGRIFEAHTSGDFDNNLVTVMNSALFMIQSALEQPEYPMSRCDWSPLWVTAGYGWPRIVELFLLCGAKVNRCSGINTTTALHETVLEAGSLHGAKGNREKSPTNTDYLGVARVLLRYGADPTLVCGRDAQTTLDAARSRGGDLMEFVELFEADPRVQRRESRRTCAYCEGVASCVQPPFQL